MFCHRIRLGYKSNFPKGFLAGKKRSSVTNLSVCFSLVYFLVAHIPQINMYLYLLISEYERNYKISFIDAEKRFRYLNISEPLTQQQATLQPYVEEHNINVE